MDAKSSDSKLNLVGYVARQSFASMFCDPISVKRSDIKGLSNFQKTAVLNDFYKGTKSLLDLCSYDVLLMDFLVERYRVVEIASGSRLTVSTSLTQSKLLDTLTVSESLKPNTDSRLLLAKHGIDTAIARALIRKKKVIVNRLYWKRLNHDGTLTTTQGKAVSDLKIAQENEKLHYLYAHVEKKHGDKVVFLDHDPLDMVGDPDYKWGAEPFHYTQQFYEKAAGRLAELSCGNEVGKRSGTLTKITSFFSSLKV